MKFFLFIDIIDEIKIIVDSLIRIKGVFMSTILHVGSGVGQAVKWISDEHKMTGKPDRDLINDALLKFDLTPLDGDFLIRNLKTISDQYSKHKKNDELKPIGHHFFEYQMRKST